MVTLKSETESEQKKTKRKILLRSVEHGFGKHYFIEQKNPEPKVRTLIPMYKPLEVTECKKLGNTIRPSFVLCDMSREVTRKYILFDC